ncbi:MAG: hypothetical protein R3D33_13595 [Hyphomicrobiaceae bacterium]
MASEIGTLIRSLESSRSKLEAELKRNEAYRALDQLEQREAAGKPLLTVSGTGLRAKLETELRDEPLYVAKRKIDEALRLLNGQRATDDASSGTAAAIASAVAAALPAVSAGRDAGDTMAEAVPQAEAGGVAVAAGSAAIAAHAGAAGVAEAVVGDEIEATSPATGAAIADVPTAEATDPVETSDSRIEPTAGRGLADAASRADLARIADQAVAAALATLAAGGAPMRPAGSSEDRGDRPVEADTAASETIEPVAEPEVPPVAAAEPTTGDAAVTAAEGASAAAVAAEAVPADLDRPAEPVVTSDPIRAAALMAAGAAVTLTRPEREAASDAVAEASVVAEPASPTAETEDSIKARAEAAKARGADLLAAAAASVAEWGVERSEEVAAPAPEASVDGAAPVVPDREAADQAVAPLTGGRAETIVPRSLAVAAAVQVFQGRAPASEPPVPADLTLIEGIDAALVARLELAGVKTFADIAGWSASEARAMSHHLGLGRRVPAENWIEQAAMLAAGRWTAAARRRRAGVTITPLRDQPLGAMPAEEAAPSAASVQSAEALPSTSAPVSGAGTAVRPAAERDAFSEVEAAVAATVATAGRIGRADVRATGISGEASPGAARAATAAEASPPVEAPSGGVSRSERPRRRSGGRVPRARRPVSRRGRGS